MNRTVRVLLNYVSSVGSTAITIAVSVLTTPILVRLLGPARFGAYRAIFDWTGHFVLLELGLGGAVSALLAQAWASGDLSRVRRVMVTGLRFYALVALVQAAAGSALVLLVTRLVPVPAAMQGDLRRATVIVVAGMLFQSQLIPFRLLLDSRQRGYLISSLLTVQNLATILLSVVLAGLGWGISSQAIAALVCTGLNALMLTHLELRRDPHLIRAAVAAPADPEVRRRLLGLNRGSLLCGSAMRIGLYSDRIIISAVLGAAMVTPLYLTQRLVELAQVQLQAIGSSSWAALAELYHQGHRDAFGRRVLDLTGAIATLGVAGLVPIVAYNGHFIALWVGARDYAGDLVTLVAAGNAFLWSLSCFWNFCFEGTGTINLLVPMSLAAVAINLTISLLAVRPLGVLGPLVGSLVSLACVNAWYQPLLLRRTFGIPLTGLARAIGRPLLLGIPYAAALEWAARSHRPAGWVGLGAEMALAPAAYLLAWWRLGMDRDRRRAIRERLRGMLGRWRAAGGAG